MFCLRLRCIRFLQVAMICRELQIYLFLHYSLKSLMEIRTNSWVTWTKPKDLFSMVVFVLGLYFKYSFLCFLLLFRSLQVCNSCVVSIVFTIIITSVIKIPNQVCRRYCLTQLQNKELSLLKLCHHLCSSDTC